ncbi:MAG: SO_0444 family Cu/Zn efflux transporter [Victivallales bacterium]|nr:SO_0444 family Cu/Zn efflux transporter [Victivallales bacterium]
MMNYFIEFLLEFWNTTCRMAPWLLFGFLMAGILSVLFKPAFVEKHLGGSRLGSIVKASLFGVPLPLCSCGVVPVALGLRKHGAGKGATASFLISTPQTGVDSFLVTWSLLGWIFALFKVVVAFIAGIVGGMTIEFFDRDDASESGAASDKSTSPSEGGNKIVHVFKYGFGTLLDDVAMTLLAGLFIAAIISIVLPPELLSGYSGSYVVSMLVMLAVGIPLYVCSTASVPVAAALMLKGVSPGAALVFLIAGPATNAATLTAMSKILGRRSLVVYLVSLSWLAVGAGVLLDFISTALPEGGMQVNCHEEFSLWSRLSGGLLLGLILLSMLKKFIVRMSGDKSSCCCDMDSVPVNALRFQVPDMTCEHCAGAIKSAVEGIAGIEYCEVCLSSKTVMVFFNGEPEAQAVENAIRTAGYTVRKQV